MKGLSIRLLAAAFLVGSAACTQYADVGVTTSQSLVSGCQKVADLTVKNGTADADVNKVLSDEARAKGANYVLVASDGARTGAAYACSGPKVATK
jgi:hypothetical protein